MKNIIMIGLLVFFYGCESEPIIKNGITYSDERMYELLKEKNLLNSLEDIKENACKIWAKEITKKNNQKLVNEIRSIYPDFIPTGSMAYGVSTKINDTVANSEAVGYGVNAKAGLAGLALSGIAELYQSNKNKPILEDSRVKKILAKYNNDFEKRLAANITTCSIKVTNVDIGEWEIVSHLFMDDTVERDVEINCIIDDRELNIDETQKKGFDLPTKVDSLFLHSGWNAF